MVQSFTPLHSPMAMGLSLCQAPVGTGCSPPSLSVVVGVAGTLWCLSFIVVASVAQCLFIVSQ